MKRALTGLAAAAAFAAGTAVLPTAANAFPIWVVPAIMFAGATGLAVGAHEAPPPPPPPPAYAPEQRPTLGCHSAWENGPYGWHQVTVCDSP